MNIVFCEGQNDRNFLHETITHRLAVNPIEVETYEKVRLLIRDIQSNRQKNILISEGGGFPKCIKIAVRFTRQFWWENTLLSVGVVADSDRGPVYNKFTKYLNEFLHTPCRKHNVCPQLTPSDSEQKLTIDFGHDRVIEMWILEIPENLEHQIAVIFKSKYPKLRSVNDNDEVIKLASSMLKISVEDVVRRAVRSLKNKNWFNKFCRRLGQNLSVSS